MFKANWYGTDWKSNKKSQDFLFSFNSNWSPSTLSFPLFYLWYKFFLWYKCCFLKWLLSRGSVMLSTPFLTWLCLNVLIQVDHLLKLHFRNQKNSSHMIKKKKKQRRARAWGWGERVVYAGNSARNNWCSSTIGNWRLVFPQSSGEIIQIYILIKL